MRQTLSATTQSLEQEQSVTGIACVYLPVADVYTSAHWYMRHFGLMCSSNTPLQPNMPHVILLYPGQGPGLFLIACDSNSTAIRRRDGEGWLSFCFTVEDIQEMFRHLQANNVRLESDTPIDRGSCGLNLRFYDPDGNRLELVQAERRNPDEPSNELMTLDLTLVYRRRNASSN